MLSITEEYYSNPYALKIKILPTVNSADTINVPEVTTHRIMFVIQKM